MPAHQLLREAVLLTLIKGDDRIERTAIIVAIGRLIPVTDIDSLGNLGNFSEWYLILNSTSAREEDLKNDQLQVGDQVFMISEPYKHVKLIRLLNVPPSVSDEDIRSIVSNWGESVLSIDSERLPRPYETIKTFIRRIRVRFSCRQDEDKVPFSIKYNSFTFPVQPEGRGKVCYRCKKAGHIKAMCTILKCQKCYQLGHDDPSCQQRKSYATAAMSTPSDADPISSPAEQASLIGLPTLTERATNAPALPHPKLPVCRTCKQMGHKRKDCPQRENPFNQLNEHGGNNQADSVEEGSSNQLNEYGANNQADPVEGALNQCGESGVNNHENPIDIPVVTLGKDNNTTSVNTTQTTIVNENKNILVTTFADGLQHRILYEAYKSTNNDFKRTCADEG